ncbi:hypothetical protein Clacol_007206 [Clathrus columnatus]|uniref:Uncharacterized protein n=1 Tax=Clathrus columnatus TaxID=1419009 RepID=A0AAV5AEA1_9AGAM|nr:hypothetical protein Clacol_007206 [Clathrus columnatus]
MDPYIPLFTSVKTMTTVFLNTFRVKRHLHFKTTLVENRRKYSSGKWNFHTTEPESHLLLPPRPSRTKSLAGTVQFHSSYLFLHDVEDPNNWLRVFNSPLFSRLKERLGKRNVLVNICQSKPYYGGTLWTKGKHQDSLHEGFFFPVISSDEAVSVLEGHLDKLTDEEDDDDSNAVAVAEMAAVESRIAKELASAGPYFYICCHGHRDCRCGIRGGDLANALTDELESRNMLTDEQGRHRLGRVGHVGGHKNAPNLIIFPHGDWYGNLEPSDLPNLVNHYIQSSPLLSLSELLLHGPNRYQWRGCMGMTKQEQLDAFQKSQQQQAGSNDDPMLT